MTYTFVLILYFIVVLVISLLMHRFFVIRAERYKIKKANTSAERWSSQTKPILGGLTFYSSFLMGILSYFIFFDAQNLLHPEVLATILVVTIGFLMGLADDMLNTPPGFKFVFQVLSALILIYSGLYIHVFENIWLNYGLTLFWVVGIMNSLNMLDNMDAVTTSVTSTILAGSLLVLAFSNSSSGVFFIIALAVFASLLSFLYYNWHPAKMYMGDNGSQFLGAFMAIISIKVFWNAPSVQDFSNWFPFLFAFIAFVVPISDTTSVTINRLMRGQSPFIGGRDHTTHHLSYLGLSDRGVALVLLTLNAIFTGLAVFMILNPNQTLLNHWFVGIIALLVGVTLYVITKISKPKK